MAAHDAEAMEREGIDNRHLELLLGWMLRDTSNCIDIGANEGRFLRTILDRATHGRHFAWEPLPPFAQALRTAFPTVDVHQAALSDHEGTAEFMFVRDSPGYSGLRKRSYPGEYKPESIQVQLERLDDVLPDDYAPAFIKVDVEGAEREVFTGGLKTICRHRPMIAFEHGLGGADHYGTTPGDIWDLLAGEAKLNIFDMDGVGPMSREQLADVFDTAARWNYLALP